MDRPLTAEEQKTVADLTEVSADLADWAAEQFQLGFTDKQVWQRLRRAAALREADEAKA
jgi:hypothetical protein